MSRISLMFQSVVYATVLSVFVPSFALADLYTGSGAGGFGGAVSGSQMDWTDDGTTVSVSFTKGTGGFSDTFVLYLDTGATGRSAIDNLVNDRADSNRAAISFMEAGTAKSLTLPSGFQASHAISINTGFGGLWSIPTTGSVGNNGLGFVAGVGGPSSSTDAVFSFSFDIADIGLTPNSGAEVKFVATYLNPFGGGSNFGFASNEGYGDGFPGGNIGQDDFSFSGSPLSYVTAVPEPSAFLFGSLVCGVLGLNYRRRQS